MTIFESNTNLFNLKYTLVIYFYAGVVDDKVFILTDQEAEHCVKVLRYSIGDEVYATDGLGNRYRGVISSTTNKKVIVQILEKWSKLESKDYYPIIAVSILKSKDRFEWFVEKAVEIGVRSIVPLICRNTEIKKINIERIQNQVRSATKQSGRVLLPNVYEPMKFGALVNTNWDVDDKLICNFNPDNEWISSRVIPNKKYLAIVGPEGDFTPEELMLAHQANIQAVNLSEFRLRSETAALQVVQTISIFRTHLKITNQ